jgi:hypothetical protein
MFHENASVPAQEPIVTAMTPQTAMERIADEMPDTPNEPTADQQQAQRISDVPWWILEKFPVTTTKNGYKKLSPSSDFLTTLMRDGPELLDDALNRLFIGADARNTEEQALVKTATDEVKDLTESFVSISDRAQGYLKRMLVDAMYRETYYAASSQFELENWYRRAHAKQQDVTNDDRFNSKIEFREAAIRNAAFFHQLLVRSWPEERIDVPRAMKRIAYSEGERNTREYLLPKQDQPTDAAQAAVDMSLLRSFAKKPAKAA